ncbi:MAG: alpha-galactosidase [Clostridia bacterium]|nr:alpha-galactosidase [Clostridia bacterium]
MILDFSDNSLSLVFEVAEDGTLHLRRFDRRADFSFVPAPLSPACELQITGENPYCKRGSIQHGLWGGKNLLYRSHTCTDLPDGRLLTFLLSDGRVEVKVYYRLFSAISVLRCWAKVENISKESIGLEYLSSFAYAGFDGGSLPIEEKMRILIPHNAWERELQWTEHTLAQLGMVRANESATNRIHVANSGSWSTKEYLPMAAITNSEVESIYLFQIEHNGSWQWEIGDASGRLYMHLSGPAEQDNHFWRQLAPGESFESVKVAVALGKDLNGALGALTDYRRKIARRDGPDADLPIIFNDYMNCLGANPTEERELPIIDRAAETGAEIYVMDAGWYAEGSWWDTIGEWQECASRFPHGLKFVFDYVREKGMIPGIWLEPEAMGVNCPLAKEWPNECFFMRHGRRVIVRSRYQLDYRHPTVRAYIHSVIDRLIADYGVGYFKLDYNIDSGIGTETGADSFGDGLYQHNLAVLSLLDEVHEKHPNVILENCSSGGMRMDYASLAHSHLQSTSDQTSYLRYAHIAALAPTAVLPEQAAVWSYPKATDSLDGVVMNMVNSMPLRVHLSGQIDRLSDEQLALVREGIAVMKTIRTDTAASLPFYPLGLPTYEKKLLCTAYTCGARTRVALWRLDTEEDTLTLPISCKTARVLYPTGFDGKLSVENNIPSVRLPRKNTAVFIEVE